MNDYISGVSVSSDQYSVTYTFDFDSPFNGVNSGVRVRFDHVDDGGHWDKPSLEVWVEASNGGDHKRADDFTEQLTMLMIVQQWVKDNAAQVEQTLREWEDRPAAA